MVEWRFQNNTEHWGVRVGVHNSLSTVRSYAYCTSASLSLLMSQLCPFAEMGVCPFGDRYA